jgi:hypothetical protein
MTWLIVTTHRRVIKTGSRDHALWAVAVNKLEGETILRVEAVEAASS